MMPPMTVVSISSYPTATLSYQHMENWRVADSAAPRVYKSWSTPDASTIHPYLDALKRSEVIPLNGDS